MLAELIPANLPMPVGGAPRSPGVHVSAAIRCIATEANLLAPEWVDELSLVDLSQQTWWDNLTVDSQLRVSIGLAWERWYIPNLGNVVDHPGEMQVDGIYMTPDGESIDMILTRKDDRGVYVPISLEEARKYDENLLPLEGLSRRHVNCIHEVKATYKSVKTVGNLESQWLWITQAQAYCKGAGTTVAYLHVLFLCGDYKYPIRPQLMVWRLTFTEQEIDEKWSLLRDYVWENQHLLRGLET